MKNNIIQGLLYITITFLLIYIAIILLYSSKVASLYEYAPVPYGTIIQEYTFPLNKFNIKINSDEKYVEISKLDQNQKVQIKIKNQVFDNDFLIEWIDSNSFLIPNDSCKLFIMRIILPIEKNFSIDGIDCQ